ncbi:MAG: HlyD family efflux transporter periplasmic adaptor subunit [Opitutaceae bacterium]|nr:HlyD family efflux transporter periplasmic adaptor subunit [Opitutaceae bacterium]
MAFEEKAHESQLNTSRVEIKQLEAIKALLLRQVENLSVRAGIEGILQRLPVEVGQQLALGEVLAEVADPTKLKAVIQIQETQARDILIGQKASVDTRNGLIEGLVFRIDPAVDNGTVAVDIQLISEYPRGARPDLTVEGTIELERIADTIYVGRPAFGREGSSMSLFKFETETSTYAMRTKVRFGSSSVSVIEVLEGLEPGDRVILSDVSQWEKFDRINVN